MLAVEMVVLLVKVPPGQGLHHAIDPKVFTPPLHGCNWLHPNGGDDSSRFTFQAQAHLILAQVAQPLAVPE